MPMSSTLPKSLTPLWRAKTMLKRPAMEVTAESSTPLPTVNAGMKAVRFGRSSQRWTMLSP